MVLVRDPGVEPRGIRVCQDDLVLVTPADVDLLLPDLEVGIEVGTLDDSQRSHRVEGRQVERYAAVKRRPLLEDERVGRDVLHLV